MSKTRCLEQDAMSSIPRASLQPRDGEAGVNLRQARAGACVIGTINSVELLELIFAFSPASNSTRLEAIRKVSTDDAIYVCRILQLL